MGKKRTNEQFIDDLRCENSSIEAIDTYVDNNTPIRFSCKICGNVWSARPGKILNAHHGCPRCGHKRHGELKTRKSRDEFDEKLKNINSTIRRTGEYIKSSVKISFMCDVCHRPFNATPNSILSKHGCPFCSASKWERECITYFDDFVDVWCETQKTFDDLIGIHGGKLKFDVCVHMNDGDMSLVEYDGEYHYANNYDAYKLYVQQIHDEIKNNYCKDKGIKLLRIPFQYKDSIEDVLTKYVIDNFVEIQSDAAQMFADLY